MPALRQTGDAEVYRQYCTDEVMARDLNLPFHGHRRKAQRRMLSTP